jgi:hypothetical protein
MEELGELGELGEKQNEKIEFDIYSVKFNIVLEQINNEIEMINEEIPIEIDIFQEKNSEILRKNSYAAVKTNDFFFAKISSLLKSSLKLRKLSKLHSKVDKLFSLYFRWLPF